MNALRKMSALLNRHAQAFWYVLTVILPILLRTSRRPVIFSKYSGIGDIICTFPAALELKKRHPGATFIYNCHLEFTCLPRLASVTDWTTSLLPIGLIGYWYGFLLCGFYHFDSHDDHPDILPSEIMIKNFGRQWGIEVGDNHPRLQSRPATITRVKSLLEGKNLLQSTLIVIHTGPTWQVKEWPHESWARLVTLLKRHSNSAVIQIGTNRHLALGIVEREGIPGSISLVNQLTLEESVALVAQSHLFIGIDSGLLHVAAATGTPAVGLWGATSSQWLFSRANARAFVTSPAACQGCHHRVPRLHWMTGCPHEIICMKQISVDEVLAACIKSLKK